MKSPVVFFMLMMLILTGFAQSSSLEKERSGILYYLNMVRQTPVVYLDSILMPSIKENKNSFFVRSLIKELKELQPMQGLTEDKPSTTLPLNMRRIWEKAVKQDIILLQVPPIEAGSSHFRKNFLLLAKIVIMAFPMPVQ